MQPDCQKLIRYEVDMRGSELVQLKCRLCNLSYQSLACLACLSACPPACPWRGPCSAVWTYSPDSCTIKAEGKGSEQYIRYISKEPGRMPRSRDGDEDLTHCTAQARQCRSYPQTTTRVHPRTRGTELPGPEYQWKQSPHQYGCTGGQAPRAKGHCSFRWH